MSQRLVIDPITRIEGHLRIEARLEEGRIAEAFSSGTMVRGIETILAGRDPRDAWAMTQRICGVCTLVHGLASVRAVENALHYTIPANAQLIRNLMLGAQYVHDHVMHFYHLHALDWVDVASALKADPRLTASLAQSMGSHATSSSAHFSGVQKRLKALVESGQHGIFSHGWWGHPGYKLPPETNLLAVTHYLEALEWQREVVQLHTLFGGKNPHPNLVVGGVPCTLAGPEAAESGTAIDTAALQVIAGVIQRMAAFVDQVYLPDLLAIARFYPEWAEVGEGVGNFLCYGEFPGKGMEETSHYLVPPGVIMGRDLETLHPLDLGAENQVQEFITHSWYKGDGKQGLHPYQGETVLDYTGPQPPLEQLDVSKGYSWIKSPRWRGLPMEVGPLARVLVMYASGHAQTRELVGASLAQLHLPVTAVFSTLGRTLARAVETKVFVDALGGWFAELLANVKAGKLDTFNSELWEPSTWPFQAQGVGTVEAPRGALGHWITIRERRTAHYQVVVPSTWNAGPRDANGKPGPYEAALQGQTIKDPDRPLEVLRTIHSFDPCIACAVHLVDQDGQERMQVKIR